MGLRMSATINLNARNAWCDCIRGYAILLVCVSHLFYVDPLYVRGAFLTHYIKGDTGVFMFYVLSGFLVTGILSREISLQDRLVARMHTMTHFFARRIFRLQPSYLLFFALYFFIPRGDDHLSWWVLLLPLSNWFTGPYITWHIKTLHVEETYYLFIGCCSVFFWRSLKPLLWTLLFLGPVGRAALFIMVKYGNEPARWWLDRYLPIEAFAVGGLLVLYLEQVQSFRFIQTITRNPKTSFALAMLLLLVTCALRNEKPFSYLLVLTWPLIFSILSAVMILSGLQTERFLFSSAWLRKLGLVSYTVYLFQQFALGPWSETYGVQFNWVRWCGLIAAIGLLLPLWYRFVEKPLTDLGSRLFPRMAKRAGH
jgi:peptidoglycan/LPS O-acetylase OafA/YrhL